MAMIPPEFERVKLNTFEPSVTSPKVDDALRGLVISAPRTITLDGGIRIPICGVYQVTAAFLGRFVSMDNEIVIVAVDTKRHMPCASNLLPEGFTVEPETGGEGDRGDLETTVLTGWFNLDLFRLMPELPREAASYHVFATVGDVVSNVVTVSLVSA